MTQYLLFSGQSAVNQSLKLYTSPTLAFYALRATQVTQMLSIKVYSLARSYKLIPKLER